MAQLVCDHCSYSREVPDKHIGRPIKCPQCGNRGTVASDHQGTVVEEADDGVPVRRNSGGSIQIHTADGVAVNAQSTIAYEWVTVSEPNYPTRLMGDAGVRAVYEPATSHCPGGFYYQSDYKLQSCERIQAVEVRFLTFNVWGTHTGTLSAVQIHDMDLDWPYNFRGSWTIPTENQASEHYASISFIFRIRTTAGQVLLADPGTVLQEAKRFSGDLPEAALEPTRRNKDGDLSGFTVKRSTGL